MQDHDCLASNTRALFQAVQASDVGLLHVGHVRSHVGHPANECVDALAKWACRHGVDDCHPFQLSVAAAARDGSLAWWWFVLASVRDPACWPCHVGGDFVDKARHDDESLPTAAESRSWFGLEGADSVGICGPGLTVCFRAMTVNVQTLAQDPSSEAASDNDGFTGRAAFLREQCRYHGVNILALQETRTKKFDTFNSHSHIRLCSGCDSHGHHGVELWFDKHLALSTCVADPIRVQLSDLLVLFADPRTLLVRFTRRGLHILFVVVHAPTAASPERAHWWKVLSERVSRFSRGCWVVPSRGLQHTFRGFHPPIGSGILFGMQLARSLLASLHSYSSMTCGCPALFPAAIPDPARHGSLRTAFMDRGLTSSPFPLHGPRGRAPRRYTTTLIGDSRMSTIFPFGWILRSLRAPSLV